MDDTTMNTHNDTLIDTITISPNSSTISIGNINTNQIHPFSVKSQYGELTVTDAIDGIKLIQSQLNVSYVMSSTFETSEDFRNNVKRQLANDIANSMLENSLIDFTFRKDVNKDVLVVNARGYVTNSSFVKTLALLYKSTK